MDAGTIFSAIGGSALAGVLTIWGNSIVTARSQGKLEGVINTEIGALKERTTKIEVEQKDQWSRISEHTEDIAFLKGRQSRANGAAAGHGT